MSRRTEDSDDVEVMAVECVQHSLIYETPEQAAEGLSIRTIKLLSKAPSEHVFVNLIGKRFDQLVVIEKTEKRDYKGSVMWKCRCDCGTECTYSEDELVHHRIRSCGCYRLNVLNHNLNNGLHRTQGTCLERLCISKARADSKSGYVGIYITTKGRYRATIGLQGKRYNLGTYSTLEEAIRARKHGEELHHEFLQKYKDQLFAEGESS